MVTQFLNLIFTYFPIMNDSGKSKEISSTSFVVSYLLNIKNKVALALVLFFYCAI